MRIIILKALTSGHFCFKFIIVWLYTLEINWGFVCDLHCFNNAHIGGKM